MRRLAFLFLLLVPSWVLAWLLDQGADHRVQHIEVWWVCIVTVGMVFAIRNLLDAHRDSVLFRSVGVNGARQLVVEYTREWEIVRLAQQSFLLLVGVIAMTTVPSASTTTATLRVAGYSLFLLAATGLSYNSWLTFMFNHDLDALVADFDNPRGREIRQREQRRQLAEQQDVHNKHLARSELEDRQEKEE